ncbi:MAG: hypothetical protein KME22_28460 [Hassallia sp. WJT32-NPBG1]|nr:hypothetical protein [Hassallia sp. WJT32-NPBG1]
MLRLIGAKQAIARFEEKISYQIPRKIIKRLLNKYCSSAAQLDKPKV